MDGDVALTAAIFALVLLARAQMRLTRLEEVVQRMVGPDETVALRGTRAESQATWAAAILSLVYLVGDTVLRVHASGLFSGG